MVEIRSVGSDADKDWKILLSTMIVFAIASVVFHVLVLVRSSSIGKSLSNKTETSTELINTTKLGQTLAIYDERAKESERLSSTTFSFVDPAR